MNNLVKCARCDKVLIAESFKHHACSPSYSGLKEIEVDSFTTFTDNDGREVLAAYGMDGVSYYLHLSNTEKIPIPFEPTKRKVTASQPNDDVTEPSSGFC